MAVTTGEASLPDIGELSYNGCIFNQLYKSRCNGAAIPDNAGRTVKWVEWTIEVEAFVTLAAADDTTDPNMEDIRIALETYGGQLMYKGKGLGNNFLINAPFGGTKDLAWGPKTKLVSFQPLGSSRGAMVNWSVTTCIPELTQAPAGNAGNQRVPNQPDRLPPVVQFNEGITISYDDECYAKVSIKGTLEIPLTRNAQTDRTIATTVDNVRVAYLSRTLDLTVYRVTTRTFDFSRDKRTCEWEFSYEELPPMGLPPGATSARGTYSVRPTKQGVALFPWICSLRATYTIRKDITRRVAWWAFAGLMKYRMEQSRAGFVPEGLNPNVPGVNGNVGVGPSAPDESLEAPSQDVLLQGANNIGSIYEKYFAALNQKFPPQKTLNERKAFLIHFGIDEGLYLDSKTVSFEASWMLFTTMEQILRASGVWKYTGVEGGQAWAISMLDVEGPNSWLKTRIDPRADIIVDLGGP